MKQLIWENLLLLGYKPEGTLQEFLHLIGISSCQKWMESIFTFLYQKFDSEEAQQKLILPVTHQNQKEFKNHIYHWLEKLKKENILPYDLMLRKSVLDTCQGQRYDQLLLAVTNSFLKHSCSFEMDNDADLQSVLEHEKESFQKEYCHYEEERKEIFEFSQTLQQQYEQLRIEKNEYQPTEECLSWTTVDEELKELDGMLRELKNFEQLEHNFTQLISIIQFPHQKILLQGQSEKYKMPIDSSLQSEISKLELKPVLNNHLNLNDFIQMWNLYFNNWRLDNLPSDKELTEYQKMESLLLDQFENNINALYDKTFSLLQLIKSHQKEIEAEDVENTIGFDLPDIDFYLKSTNTEKRKINFFEIIQTPIIDEEISKTTEKQIYHSGSSINTKFTNSIPTQKIKKKIIFEEKENIDEPSVLGFDDLEETSLLADVSMMHSPLADQSFFH